MKIYNTLSGRKEELVTLNPGRVNMYVCGPTTYNYIHLGNARPLVVFDTVRRYLVFQGYNVRYVQNFTDVDDKIINRAREEGDDPIKLAERYINEYFIDADALGINRADIHPRVSQHIPDIITAIEGLIAKGFAYEIDGDVYYRVKAFPEYGKLSGRSLDDMLAGARVEVDERKEAPVDFALWKQAKPGEPYWDSPWGPGRPGWHIECSVMSTKYLGDTFDIHGGGADLIFPHHENEIAQAEAYTGKPFVNYWMHNGFITVNSEKMSKSLGNFFILRDILARYPHDVVRYYLIATHYRSPLDFDDGKLEEAKKALGRLKTTMSLAKEFLAGATVEPVPLVAEAELTTRVTELKDKFIEAMDDDFNSAKALGYLFELSHQINAFISGADPTQATDKAILRQAIEIFSVLGGVLGIFMDTSPAGQQVVDDLIKTILTMRDQARHEKYYALADSLRDFLNKQDIKVEDKAGGSQFRYEKAPDIEVMVNFLLALRQDFKVKKEYGRADRLRDELKDAGITLEDTREGVRWKFADA
ncbi:MAG: cysteine--tRNA ligase [Syntrophomonadaceae bacterium]